MDNNEVSAAIPNFPHIRYTPSNSPLFSKNAFSDALTSMQDAYFHIRNT